MITTDLRLNEPRYVKLPDIMKAKKKPIEIMAIDSLGVDTAPVLRVNNYDTPPARAKGAMVKNRRRTGRCPARQGRCWHEPAFLIIAEHDGEHLNPEHRPLRRLRQSPSSPPGPRYRRLRQQPRCDSN